MLTHAKRRLWNCYDRLRAWGRDPAARWTTYEAARFWFAEAGVWAKSAVPLYLALRLAFGAPAQ